MLYMAKNFIFLLAFLNGLDAEIIARIVKVDGNVYLKRLGMSTFSERAKTGVAIFNGDEIKVGERSFSAIIYIDDRSVIKIRGNTKFGFMDTRNSRTVELEYGTLLNDVKIKDGTKTYRIQTPVSVASVKGTQFAAIVSQNGVDQFICKEGLFEVLNIISGETVSVSEGQKAVSNSSGNLVQAPSSLQEYPRDPEIEDVIDYEVEEEIQQENIYEETKIDNEPQKLKIEEENNSKDIEIEEIEEIKEIEKISPENKKEKQEKIENDLPDEAPVDPFSLGLGIGSVTLENVLYNQIALRPEFNIWKIGVGLDLALYIDNEGNVRYDEWDVENDPELLLDKILFIKYGRKVDPFWIKYGSIEGMTLGYGGILNNYSNMMEFPSVRKVGINAGVNIGPVKSEIFLANLKDINRGGTITGFRSSYTISKNIPFTIGFNYVVDQNMFSALKDKDEDSYPDLFDDFPDSSNLWNDTDGDGVPDPHENLSEDRWDIDADGDNLFDYGDNSDDTILLKATPFSLKNNEAKTTALGFDIGYPVYNSKLFSLEVFAEYNKINFISFTTSDSTFNRPGRSGTGLTIPGIKSKLLGVIDFSLEYRILNGSFLPKFFDQGYDLNRISTSIEGNSTRVLTKDMSILKTSSTTNSNGIYGSAGFNFFNLVTFSASYANMKSDTSEIKSFNSFLVFNTENIPKISTASAYFQRNNDSDPFDFKNPSINTIMGYKIGYELSRGVSLIYDFRQYYRDDGTGEVEAIKQTTIETTFNF